MVARPQTDEARTIVPETEGELSARLAHERAVDEADDRFRRALVEEARAELAAGLGIRGAEASAALDAFAEGRLAAPAGSADRRRG